MKDTSFLTAEQVVDYLQGDVRTVYRLIRGGTLPAVRVGRQWRFRKRDIDVRDLVRKVGVREVRGINRSISLPKSPRHLHK